MADNDRRHIQRRTQQQKIERNSGLEFALRVKTNKRIAIALGLRP